MKRERQLEVAAEITTASRSLRTLELELEGAGPARGRLLASLHLGRAIRELDDAALTLDPRPHAPGAEDCR